MVDPKVLCRKHLLGEHVEVHMLAGSLLHGRSIKGFLDKDILEPQNVQTRHDTLAEEMGRRGYAHASLLPILPPLEQRNEGHVDVAVSMTELARRCLACRMLQIAALKARPKIARK